MGREMLKWEMCEEETVKDGVCEMENTEWVD